MFFECPAQKCTAVQHSSTNFTVQVMRTTTYIQFKNSTYTGVIPKEGRSVSDVVQLPQTTQRIINIGLAMTCVVVRV
jgi:hypothetical protein